MGRIPDERHGTVAPLFDRLAINHRVFKDRFGRGDQLWNVDPAKIPIGKIPIKAADIDAAVPVFFGDIRVWIDGFFSDPVDHRQSGVRVRCRNRIRHKALRIMASQDHRAAAQKRARQSCAAPHDCTAPDWGTFSWVHLRANGRMDPVCADDHFAADLFGFAILGIAQDGLIARLRKPKSARAEGHAIGTTTFLNLGQKGHL